MVGLAHPVQQSAAEKGALELYLQHCEKKSKVKQPYLMSITCNSNSTDKPEVNSALILLPLYISAPFYRYLKLLKSHRTERS